MPEPLSAFVGAPPVLNRPDPGEFVLSSPTATATIDFEVQSMNTGRLFGLLHLATETAPAPPASGDPHASYMLFDKAGNIFTKTLSVPAAHICSPNPVTANNLKLTVIRESDAGVWDTDRHSWGFRGVCATMEVVVPATACPWFAYAYDTPGGPSGESIVLHRPVRVRVPRGAHRVTITPTLTDRWRHEPTVSGTSGPEGYGANIPLYTTEYASPLYTQGKISPPNYLFPVNALVGLAELDGATASSIFLIGAGHQAAQFLCVDGIKALFFGMWDGTQWNGDISNSGSIKVTLTWSAAACQAVIT